MGKKETSPALKSLKELAFERSIGKLRIIRKQSLPFWHEVLPLRSLSFFYSVFLSVSFSIFHQDQPPLLLLELANLVETSVRCVRVFS